MIAHLRKGDGNMLTERLHKRTLGGMRQTTTDFTFSLIRLRAELFVMLICISPFESHVFVFFLEPLDGLSVCSALVFYMLLGAFDFLSRVC